MSHPPLRRFFGFEDDVSDRILLGFKPGEIVDSNRITAALDANLARLDRHPGARSASAAVVRRRLGEAAGRLMASNPRPVTSEQPEKTPKRPSALPLEDPISSEQAAESEEAIEAAVASVNSDVADTSGQRAKPIAPGEASIAELTDFDRTVLAILVGSGGWNATSRGRLIGLAARRGLKPKAFMRIVSGLAQLLQGGGFETIAGTRRAIDVAIPAPRISRAPTRMEATMNQVSEMLASEFRGETSGSRTRLAIGFSLVSILLVGFFVAMLMLPSPVVERAREEAKMDAARQAIIAANEDESADSRQERQNAFSLVEEEATRVRALVPQATWDQTPNFTGNRRPHDELLRSHDAPDWISGLDTIARKASLPQNNESVRIRRDFTSFMEDAGYCWPLLEPAVRARLIAAMTKPISTTASTQLREDLISTIGEQLGPLEGPRDVWRASWAAGILGTIASDRKQPEGARVMASELLAVDLGSRRRSRATDERPFEVAVGRKLDAMVGELLAVASSQAEGTFDAWERWIEAQEAVRRGALLEVAWLDAVYAVLRDGYGLERPGKQVDILGRLLSELDFSARASDPELLRMNVQSWFEDESVPSQNLWVFTSLMAQSLDAPWWGEVLVLAPDASMDARGTLVASMTEAWPDAADFDRPRGILVPGAILDRLVGVQDQLAGMDAADTEVSSMYRLLTSAYATAAAESLERGDIETAVEDIYNAELLLGDPFIPTLRPDHLAGESTRTNERDGPWTEQWNRSRRDVSERQSILRRLKQRQGGDLGRNDAATLAMEAFRGTPREIRLLAQEVVIDSFALGPNMALALLDQFEFAPRNQDTVDFLLRLTGETLPPLADEGWREAGRMTLARHAFNVHETTLHDVARLAEDYADALRMRLDRSGGGFYYRSAQPQEAMAALVDLIQMRAESQFVTDPVPASLEELDRRRSVRWTSAVGPTQQLVAELSAAVDLAAYETSGMRPDLRRQILEEHAELTSRVAVAPSVLEQILLLEEAVGRLITMRLQAEESGAG